MSTLIDSLTASIEARLTRPLLEGWHVPYPTSVRRMTCDGCGFQHAGFIRVQADDSDVWGLAGIDGAFSDPYQVACGAC